jgi:putative tryptophan/tyrosine transport system substrate-binding protein
LDHQNHWSDAPATSLDKADRFADEALAKDEKDPFAHFVAAVVAFWKKDYERWAYEGDRALALNPNYALALLTRGILHIYTGEPAKAIPYIEKAMRLDPTAQNGQYVHFLGTAYFVAGDYETAATCFKDRITNNPTTDLSRAFLASGLVASLARPGGNITGVSLMAAETHGKCVELFRDMLPSVHRIAALGNVADPFSKPFLEQVQLAGKTTGIEIAPVTMVRGLDEIDATFATMKKEGAGAVVVQGSLATENVAELALKHRLPAATVPRSFAEVGGLMSYGADGPESFRRSAFFVIKLLQGGKPADMPVEQPTKFELVINLETAKALGLTISRDFLLRADEVIE